MHAPGLGAAQLLATRVPNPHRVPSPGCLAQLLAPVRQDFPSPPGCLRRPGCLAQLLAPVRQDFPSPPAPKPPRVPSLPKDC